jgi:AcrR family transcriptional regulator
MNVTRSSRERIIDAAATLARERGPGNLSLEAIAARAGISKGGLLYNFPTKTKLLEAVVEAYVLEFDEALRAAEALEKAPNATARAFLRVFLQEHAKKEAAPAGILAALAEGLNFLDPVRRYNRELLDRMTAQPGDAELALVVFLAVEGMRAMKLFDAEALTEEERDKVVERLFALLLPG